MTPSKVCSKCRLEKSVSAFTRSSGYRDGYRSQCTPCRVAYANERRRRPDYTPPPSATRRSHQDKARQKANFRAWKLKRRYGITVARYDELVAQQQGMCAICRRVPKTHFAIDHCHDTGRVRGLLCIPCNTAIGFLGDRPASLQRALDYVSKPYL